MFNRASLLSSLQYRIGRNEVIARAAVKIRNQLNMIIGASFSDGSNIATNGERWLLSNLAPKCRSFVDVGANRGEWTDAFLEFCIGDVRGLLVDGNPHVINHLTKKFSGSKNINVVEGVISNSQTSIRFSYSSDLDVYGGVNSSRHTVFSTQSVTLDILLGQQDWDFVKLDLEGNDFKALMGMNNIIARGGVRFIQFEYNGLWVVAGSTLGHAISWLTGLGFEVFLIRQDRLMRVNWDFWGEHFGFSNYLAVCPDESAHISPLVRGIK